MKVEHEILCSKSIIDFLNESDTPFYSITSYNTPIYNNMRKTLLKYYSDDNGMIPFVLYLNKKYHLMQKPLYKDSWIEFFATNKSRIFFNTFFNNIRKIKLETL
ncbi:hypothetical protein M0Q50_10385 [bacterium]|jgi:hypothetical protein|nr:hypothetical protein [bacterium]